MLPGMLRKGASKAYGVVRDVRTLLKLRWSGRNADMETARLVRLHHDIMERRRELLETAEMYSKGRLKRDSEMWKRVEYSKGKLRDGLVRLGYKEEDVSFVPLEEQGRIPQKPLVVEGRKVRINEILLCVRKEHSAEMVNLIMQKVMREHPKVDAAYLQRLKADIPGGIMNLFSRAARFLKKDCKVEHPNVLELGPGANPDPMLSVLREGARWTGANIAPASGKWPAYDFYNHIMKLIDKKRIKAEGVNVWKFMDAIMGGREGNEEEKEGEVGVRDRVLKYYKEQTGIENVEDALRHDPSYFNEIVKFYKNKNKEVIRPMKDMIKKLQPQLDKLGVSYVVGDIGAPTFKENSFDMAMDHGSLMYTDVFHLGSTTYFRGSTLVDILLEMRKALKPNGLFCTTEGSPLVPFFFERTHTPGLYVNAK